MRRKTDYENVVYTLMPYFRAKASEMLSNEYGMKQSRIASMLDITQAAVSKYLSSAAAGRRDIHIDGEEAYVRRFIESKLAGDSESAQKSLCKLCQTYKKFSCNLIVK